VLSRVIWGARASLLAGVVSVSSPWLIGVPIGLAGGFLGGWTDSVISRVTDALLAVPVPDPGDRAGRLPGPQPQQCDDRHRRVGHADLRAPHARPGAGVKVEDYVEAARAVGNPLAHRAAPHPAQHHCRR
jgi:peptide/nickel transport system permease protein